MSGSDPARRPWSQSRGMKDEAVMSKKLTDEQIRHYCEDGFLFPVSVLSAAEAADCRRRFAALEGRETVNRDKTMTIHIKPHLLFPWLNALVRHPVLLDAVEDLIGPDILLYSGAFIVKEPHTRGVFSLHQDRWRWRMEPMTLVNCWLAFTDANPANGSVSMIPRSHLRGELPHVLDRTGDNVISYGQTVEDVDPSTAVAIELSAGEMSMHDNSTVHGSGANGTDAKRIGYTLRYMPTHVKPIGGPRNAVTLVRGHDRHGHWDLEPSPEREMDPVCLAAHQAMLAEHAPTKYEYL